MNNKAEKLRDLLGYAANAIDEKYGIENINEEVSMETELFDKRSIILCVRTLSDFQNQRCRAYKAYI